MTVKDPVCGMEIEPARAAATEVYEEQAYFFCSEQCRQRFLETPERYIGPSAPA